MKIENALTLVKLIEDEEPVAVGLFNVLKLAHDSNTTVEELLADAKTRFDAISALAAEEIK